MKKINFNQPRYVLPIILVPFFYILNYLFMLMIPETKESELSASQNYSTELPPPSIDGEGLSSKFDSFKEVYKNRQDYSAVLEIDRNEVTDSTSFNESEKSYSTTPYSLPRVEASTNFRELASYQRQLGAKPIQTTNTTPIEDSYEKEMRMFRAQMNYIDSLSRESEPSKEVDEKQQPQEENLEREVLEVRPRKVRKDDSHTTFFNSIETRKSSPMIEAIVDQEVVVRQGSRIRLRLLESIWIGDFQLDKGQLLFGIVSSFSSERIHVTISSALVGGEILPIDLSVFDIDGLEGIYVPKNSFSDATRTVGADLVSGSQIKDNQKILTRLASGAFNTATRSASRAIKKNKAQIKYSTIIYLR